MDQTNETENKFDQLGMMFAFLLLRLWLGVRAFMTGVEKFAGKVTESAGVEAGGEPTGLTEEVTKKVYGFSHYNGVPAPLYEKFKDEPFIPGFALSIYDFLLGPILLALGITLLLGVATRTTLLAMGVLYTSLTVGLILLNEAGGVAWLGTHIILIVLALMHAKHNKFELFPKW